MKVRSRSLVYDALQFTKEVEDASMPLPKGVYRDQVMRKGFDPDTEPEVCLIDITMLQICLKVGHWIIYEDGEPIQVLTDEKYSKYYALADEIDEEKFIEDLAIRFMYIDTNGSTVWRKTAPDIQARYQEKAKTALKRATGLLLNRIDSIDEEMIKNIPHLEKLAVAVGDLQSYLRKNGESVSVPIEAGMLLQKIANAYDPLHSKYSRIVLKYRESSIEEKS